MSGMPTPPELMPTAEREPRGPRPPLLPWGAIDPKSCADRLAVLRLLVTAQQRLLSACELVATGDVTIARWHLAAAAVVLALARHKLRPELELEGGAGRMLRTPSTSRKDADDSDATDGPALPTSFPADPQGHRWSRWRERQAQASQPASRRARPAPCP